MSEFNTEYLNLLRKQVEDELEFLTRHKHDGKDNLDPCMFCFATADTFSCARMQHLREFLSLIHFELIKAK